MEYGNPVYGFDNGTELPYIAPMQTVIETPAYLASAKDENVSDEERSVIVSYIAANPDAGDIVAGTGGAR
jgi:hypothetical protein